MLSLSIRLRRSTALPSPLVRLGEMRRSFVDQLRALRHRARARRELRELDDATLRDVGLSRAQANFDADRPLRRR